MRVKMKLKVHTKCLPKDIILMLVKDFKNNLRLLIKHIKFCQILQQRDSTTWNIFEIIDPIKIRREMVLIKILIKVIKRFFNITERFKNSIWISIWNLRKNRLLEIKATLIPTKLMMTKDFGMLCITEELEITEMKSILNITKNLIDQKILCSDLWENKPRDCGKLGRNLKTRSE